jgi:signal transduction histidine kinase
MVKNKVAKLAFLFFMSIPNHSVAQTKMMDSLRNSLLISTNTKDKIEALNTIAFNIRAKYPDSTRIYSLQALQWSKNENYSIGMGVSYNNIAYTYYLINNDSALYYFKKAQVAYAIEPPSLLRASRVFNGIANVFIQKTQFDSAIYYANFSLNYINKSTDTSKQKIERLMYAYGTLGNTYYAASDYEKSTANFINATKIAEQLKNNEMLVVYYNGIANIQGTLGELEKAIFYGNKSIVASALVKDYDSWILALANQGAYYVKIKNISLARKYADSSINLGNTHNRKRYEGRNYLTYGQCKMYENNCVEALGLFKTGLLSNSLNKGSDFSKFVLLKELANTYKCLDSFKLANEFYLQSLQLGKGDRENESECYYGLATTYTKLQNYEKAYTYLAKYNAIHDSIFTTEKIKNINSLNVKFETEKKELQLDVLTKDKLVQDLVLSQKQQEIVLFNLKTKAQSEKLNAATLFALKQDQQIELQELGLKNNQLYIEKQNQQIELQSLGLSKKELDIQKQQLDLINTNNKLKIENQQKLLHLATIGSEKSKFLILALVSLITLLTGLFFFYRFRFNKKLESQRTIFNERSRLAQELHDEVGATLSGIAMYSHLAKEQIKNVQTSAIQNSLSIIQSNASEMVNKLNDIVWLINPGQDSLQKLMQRLEDYAVQIAAVKNIRVKSNLNGHFVENILPAETRRNIYLLFKEAINNAVKYSNATLLDLNVKEDNTAIKISLKDDGDGFDVDIVKHGNGLDNMQQRAKDMQTDCIIESAKGKGTSITVVIKIP